MSVRGLRTQLAVLEMGFETLGVAIGAAVYQLYRPASCVWANYSSAVEPAVFAYYEQGIDELWTAAVGRLESEAIDLGAHGVVGVTVQSSRQAQSSTTELQLSGAAIRVPDCPELPRPFLSTLSMGQFLNLLVSSWVPCGITWGFSAVHVHHYATTGWSQGTKWTNAEMVVPTAGAQLARSRAEQQARRRLSAIGAEGAVGMAVGLERSSNGCGQSPGMLIEGSVVGTGIVRFGPRSLPIDTVRNLQGRR